MIKKVGKIIIGALAALIIIGIIWYLVDAFTQNPTSEEVAMVKEDVLTNPVIEEVESRKSVIDYPVTVQDKELGKNNPFN